MESPIKENNTLENTAVGNEFDKNSAELADHYGHVQETAEQDNVEDYEEIGNSENYINTDNPTGCIQLDTKNNFFK